MASSAGVALLDSMYLLAYCAERCRDVTPKMELELFDRTGE
jgi:hypothetical protein